MKKPLKILGGIFDKNNLKSKLIEIEKTLNKKIFGKKKLVKKTLKQKKIFEEIINSYQNHSKEIKDIKDLFLLATQEKDEEIINDCNNKINEIKKN